MQSNYIFAKFTPDLYKIKSYIQKKSNIKKQKKNIERNHKKAAESEMLPFERAILNI